MKTVMKKGFIPLILLGVVIMGLGPRTFAADVWKVGVITSTTGYYAALGQEEKDAMILLLNKINEGGGILGKKVEIIFEDDEGNTAKAALLAKKLIYEDKVISILRPTFTGCCMAVVPVCENAQIPMIFMSPGPSLSRRL